MADITMPQLGETVTEGTITKWFKNKGDRVEIDEPLFEVSTDKVDSEVPSSAAGWVTDILVLEGATVDVGTTLAVISAGASDSAPAEPQAAAAPVTPAAAAPAAQPAPEPEPPAPIAAAGSVEAAPVTSGKLLSPVVRRLINENNLDVGRIAGSGQDGRITRADVLAHMDNGGTRPSPAAPAAAVAATRPAAPAAPSRTAAPVKAGADDEVIPFSNIRRRTAEHMIRSQATAAHVLVATEVDYSGVERARKAARDEFKAKEGFSLTYLPFIARAVIDALSEFPHVNASVGENELIVHRRTHLGFAVDLSFEGLIVPVVHDADQLRLPALARSVADLARRARSRELSADDISGGTFTITNPGPFGTFLTFPVINQPQVAILSTDGIRKRPVAAELPDGTDVVVVRPVGMLGLSFDHRAFDGAYASAFLARVKDTIETRDWTQEV